MKKLNKLKYCLLVLPVIFSACIEQKDLEVEKPKLELLSPFPCDTLEFGSAFSFKIRCSDNTGLGNVSMDMHNNFGHHNHGNHETCNMDAAKEAVNPYSESWIFTLPDDSLNFILDTLLSLPKFDMDSIQYDQGDYHFHLYLTDTDGYQTFTTFDVKIVQKLKQ